MYAATERAAPPIHHAEAFPGDEAAKWSLRVNFVALVFCLTIGTAALPHVLMRYYPTPTVREARESVFWSLLFILLLYITAPAYAVFVKYEVFTNLVNIPIAHLPGWVAAWSKVGLVNIEDINRDGILQLAELSLNPDVVVLATPEIAGMPYVVSGLVAAGGLAAALSTADGLLLTITSALSHDVYYRVFRPQSSTQFRLVISKSLLLVVAVLAAMVAAQKPGTILSMVAWAFSIAGSAFFPALVLGIFWRGATRTGALAGMLVGLAVAIYYIFRVEFDSLTWIGVSGLRMAPWFNVNSTAAGVFGVLSGFVTIIVVSLFSKQSVPDDRAFLDKLRRIGGGGHAPDNDRYWLRTQRLTYVLLVVWAAITFGLSWYADELNPFKLFAFPLGFYMAAQGSMIIFLALVWFYNRRMKRLERELGINNE